MTAAALFACSVAVYAGIPLLLAIRRTRAQLLLFYTHIAAVLTLGGLLGAVYVLPLSGDVSLLAGQVSYGGFMFSTLVTVIVGRDVRVVRNIVLLTVGVDVLVYLIFKITHLALSNEKIPNPSGVDPAVFDQSIDVVVLGGTLIILELLALIALLELAKRHLGRWPMAPVYVLAYVAILVLDGVLFPTVVLRPSSGLGAMIGDSVPAKLLLAGAYAVPLVLFLAFYPRLVRRFEATPLQLDQLLLLKRGDVMVRLKEQQAELEVRTEEAGRANATVGRILDAASNTLLIATDRDFRVTHFSLGAKRLLGYSESDLLGESLLEYNDPDEVARHAAELGVPADLGSVASAILDRGRRLDWAVRTRSGEHRVLSLSLTEIRDGDRLIGYLCAGEDVTGRMRTEAALTEALRRELESVARLEEADRFKDEVVSTISHELRTPIASIQGYGELIADGDLGEVTALQADALTKVLRNTARLSTLVDDLLQLDRAQSGRLSLSQVPSDLTQVARDAWDSVRQLARGRELDLTLRATDEPVPVLCDPDAVERVVLNLADNAIKFTPDGGSVAVSVEAFGGHAVLTVTDTGFGIAQEDQQQVLGRFFRSSEAYRHAIPGTGLGLTVVDAIVTAHGGSLHIDSATGAGTTVRMTLPLRRPDVGLPGS
jgi:PAS domain S-box-containing protein